MALRSSETFGFYFKTSKGPFITVFLPLLAAAAGPPPPPPAAGRHNMDITEILKLWDICVRHHGKYGQRSTRLPWLMKRRLESRMPGCAIYTAAGRRRSNNKSSASPPWRTKANNHRSSSSMYYGQGRAIILQTTCCRFDGVGVWSFLPNPSS